MGRSRKTILTWATLAIMLCAFAAARSWDPYPVVFADDDTVRLLGVDSWFHVRHAEYARDHFPGLLRNDPGARYPNAGRQQVSGLFNVMMGGAAIVVDWMSDDPRVLERVAAWTPVVLACLGFLLLFVFARRLGGPLLGLGACLVFLLFPGSSLPRSMLGFADQHVLEFVLALGSIAGLVLGVQAAYRDEKAQLDARLLYRPGRTLLFALPFALFFYSWLGAPIYLVPMALAAFGGLMFVLVAGLETHPYGLAMARFFGSVATIQLGAILLLPDWVMALGRHTEWWILTGIVLMAVLPWVYFCAVKPLDGRIPRWVVALVTTLALAGTLWLFFTQVRRGQFFFGQLTHVRGLRVAEQGDILWSDLWDRFGVPGVLAALSIPLVLLARKPLAATLLRLMTCLFGLAVFLIWLRTHDFDYAPPILIALMAVLGAEGLLTPLERALRRTSTRTMVVIPVLALLAAGMLYPWGTRYTPWATQARAMSMMRHDEAWFDAMAWLRENSPATFPTPTTAVSDTTSRSNAYGVMSAWDDGNFIAHVGRRLPVLSRFPGKRDGLWLTATTEEDSFETICPSCSGDEHVRYAVLTAELAADLFIPKAVMARREPGLQMEGYWQMPQGRIPHLSYDAAFDEAVATRLIRHRGAGMQRYRLVYASPQQAVLFTFMSSAERAVSLRHVDTDSGEGASFLDLVEGKSFTAVPGGFAFEFALVPQVMIFEIVPPVYGPGSTMANQ